MYDNFLNSVLVGVVHCCVTGVFSLPVKKPDIGRLEFVSMFCTDYIACFLYNTVYSICSVN